MSYNEDEFLLLSGVQHFAFCKRQWALIHIEQIWEENVLTVEGDLFHQRAHDESLRERRGDTLIVRGITVHSWKLGMSGKCDVVEFHLDQEGHPVNFEDGLWSEFPVEYKRGRSKISDADRLQLCGQAMCLEEMFGSDIKSGYLYYGETRQREKVDFTEEMRHQLVEMSLDMHDLYRRKHTPRVKYFKACKSCSLIESCSPQATYGQSVKSYLENNLEGENYETIA